MARSSTSGVPEVRESREKAKESREESLLAGKETGMRSCRKLLSGQRREAAKMAKGRKSRQDAASAESCETSAAKENAASELPLEFRVEDHPFCIQQGIAVVGLAEINLIADLNVLGPVPDQVGVQGLVLREQERISRSA